ncbi:type I restriction endonuclease subunit R [Paramicrobacterium sp. CJ85]|uniref:type I restriction endonuclease subunit R n=1 Tax=Paramicrobacterium sp. CJ85 TaxID=3445355 RepID=UPI003F632BAA
MGSEADWEQMALELLAEPLLWHPAGGDTIAPGRGERENWSELIIRPRILAALQKLNPTVPANYLKQALEEIVTPKSRDAITENQRIHTYLVDGYRLSYIDSDGEEVNATIRLISADPDDNDWLAVNQVTLRQGDLTRRFDVVLYVNGMPLSIMELKKAGSESATTASAHAQLQTYVDEFPMAFRFCVFTLASDGLSAKYGTPFTPLNHFAPWNVDDDGQRLEYPRFEDGDSITQLEDTILGVYNQERFLQLMRNFTAFDEGPDGLVKRIAKPHQYFAVTKAVGSTVQAVGSSGKAGVVWHTQGSGKSMEMELYANLVIRRPELKNPTIVVITDRNELDGQLFQTFDQSLLLAEKPRQIRKRSELRDELSNRTTGGIYFTTLQKFGLGKAEKDAGLTHPLLSDRRNIIVVVDEAHRSHYDDLDGYARHLKDALPNATLIAFTGTPISEAERNTREVFGNYIDIYDLTRAVEDGATVPVYFEPRLIKVGLAEGVDEDQIDELADEVTLGLDDAERARIEQGVAVINAVYGAPERIEALAEDLVTHWEERRDRMREFVSSPGKALIVGGTREICAKLYDAIVALRPEWHSDALDRGVIKVVYSGVPSDPELIRTHVRKDSQNAAIKERLKDADDELELVIVKDMMLTGFDAPPLHTLYLDRPLKGALLMQTLARVNRTFRNKHDGLLVAYAPIKENLHNALQEYTAEDQAEKPLGRDVEHEASVARELLEQARECLREFDWRSVAQSGRPKAYLNAVTGAANYLRDIRNPLNDEKLGSNTLKARFRSVSNRLARAWAVASTQGSLDDVRDEIKFYEEVRVWMAKYDALDRQSKGEPIPDDVQRLLASLIDSATAAEGAIDIYEAAGLPKPSLGELSQSYIEKAKQTETPQLAIEALRGMLVEQASVATLHNIVRQRAFSERITDLMVRYTNQQITAAQMFAALGDVSRDISEEARRGEKFDPPLEHYELAFYDAVASNESALTIQGEDTLAEIARELLKILRRDKRTDWTVRDDVRAKLRSSIKRLLVKYKYPPDQQPGAIKLVMEQMETLAPRLTEEAA